MDLGSSAYPFRHLIYGFILVCLRGVTLVEKHTFLLYHIAFEVRGLLVAGGSFSYHGTLINMLRATLAEAADLFSHFNSARVCFWCFVKQRLDALIPSPFSFLCCRES